MFVDPTSDSYQKRISKYPFLSKYTSPVKMMNRRLVGRDNEIRSILAAFCRAELSNVMLLADAGAGKALADDTLIPVNDARQYVPVGVLSVGDVVFDEQGAPCAVTNVFHQGMKAAYKVTFLDGTSIVCNDEHLWAARTSWQHYQKQDYQTVSLSDMIDRGIHKEHRKPSGKLSWSTEWYIPVGGALCRDAVDLPLDPYALGALIGDGCMMKSHSTLHMSSSDEYVVNRVAQGIGAVGYCRVCDKNYNWVFYRPEDYPHAKEGNARVKYLLWPEVLWFDDEHAFLGKKSIERRIPRIFFSGSEEQRWELLRGLMDTDGSISGNDRLNCTYATNCSGLAEDVCELATSLGMRVSLSSRMRNDSLHMNKEYRVYFIVDIVTKSKMFSLPRHLEKLNKFARSGKKFHKRFDDLGVASVENLGYECPMTCITVDSPNHLYVAGKEHIVTHNTATVQGAMMVDKKRIYLEVDVARMIANLANADELSAKLKSLFDEASHFSGTSKGEVVLFIDEFHQIIQMSPVAVEALKPLLADSATRGIRVIAATTYTEFRQHISSNQPLVERLQRINIPEPDKTTTIQILHGMAERYGVLGAIHDENLFDMIYDYTQRYIPANAQPRKSILILDAMVGWHRAEGLSLDQHLLADVIYESENVNVAFRVNAASIKKELDEKILSQGYATKVIADRLQLCVANLNDPTKPMSSFLFCGSTGVGKSALTKQLAHILFGDAQRHLIRFDMSEFASAESLDRFRVDLTSRVWERPYSIVMLDEIEKACGEVLRLLLQVLDDARLIDQNGREVSFVNSYIVLTTNLGSEVYSTIAQYDVDDEGSGAMLEDYGKLIRRSLGGSDEASSRAKFPPELLGRIDCIVPFQPLSRTAMKNIVKMKLKELIITVKEKHGVDVSLDKELLPFLIEDSISTDSNAGGARQVMQKLEDEITVSIARFINENPNVKHIGVATEGEARYGNKNRRKSDAKVVVFGVTKKKKEQKG